MIRKGSSALFSFEVFGPAEAAWEEIVTVHCLQSDPKTDAKAPPSAWAALYKRFWTYKAARCEAVTMKSVGWYLLPLIKDMEERGVALAEFSDFHMEERMARRKQAGINNNTLRSEIMLANSMFEIGVKARLLPANPLAGYKMPPEVKPHIPTPTPTRLRKLLKTIHDMRMPSRYANAAFLTPEKNRFLWRRDTAITVLDARTGMRPCEPFRLLVEDYQPEAGRVVIRAAKDREPRFVPIYDDVIAAVDAWLKVRPKNAGSNFLFVSDRGMQMTVASWSRMFKTYATEAGMPEITPRALRHYGLTAMAEVNLLAASKAAGHSSLATTKGYLHNDFEHTRAALAAVGRIDLSEIEDKRHKERII